MLSALLVVDVVYNREGIEALLRSRPELTLVGAIGNHEVAAAMRDCNSPDVVLLDTSASHARTTLSMLRALERAPKVIALARDDTPEQIVEWIEAGIAAYVPHSASISEMLQILLATVRGETHCSPKVMNIALLRLASLAETSKLRTGQLIDLTKREAEIVELLARGLSNKAIARQLSISCATAKNYVHHILDKLQLHRRAEVAACVAALRHSGRMRMVP
jgi:DNA-binding NarL/FixJ family response regulator